MASDKLVDFDHVTDYISREAAWNGIYSCPTKTDADGYIWVRTKDVAHMIDEMPAADVRPAIRCNNCRYYFFGDCIHNQGMRKTDKDGFCFRFKEVSNE